MITYFVLSVNSVNDKLISLVKSFRLAKNNRKPDSPLNPDNYNPTEALNNLSKHLNVLKSGAYSGTNSLSSEDYIVQKDPYNAIHKVQFEEAIRADGIVQRALHRKADFVFAKGVRTVLDTMDDTEYATAKEKEDATKGIIQKPEYQDAKKLVDKINRHVNFRYN